MAKPEKVLKLSIDEYLLYEDSATIKHEYVDGEVFEMTGGTLAHNTIGLNVATLLRSQLKGSGCRVYIESVKVRIESTNCFYYPDVMVDCCTYEKSNVHTTTPVIIFEVLSRTTALTDRREKMMAYKRIPSLMAYVLIHQARRCVELFRKDSEDNWTIEVIGSADKVLLDITSQQRIFMTMEDIYEDVDPEHSPDLQVHEDVEVYAVASLNSLG